MPRESRCKTNILLELHERLHEVLGKHLKDITQKEWQTAEQYVYSAKEALDYSKDTSWPFLPNVHPEPRLIRLSYDDMENIMRGPNQTTDEVIWEVTEGKMLEGMPKPSDVRMPYLVWRPMHRRPLQENATILIRGQGVWPGHPERPNAYNYQAAYFNPRTGNYMTSGGQSLAWTSKVTGLGWCYCSEVMALSDAPKKKLHSPESHKTVGDLTKCRECVQHLANRHKVTFQ